MELESIRRYLEGDDKDETATDSLPKRFHESITMKDLRVDFAEPGRVVCSMEVPPRLVDSGNCLHSAAMAMLVDVVGWSAMLTIGTSSGGVTVEINVSYMAAARVGEEIAIEAKTLRVGKAVSVVNVEFTKKKTGEIIAQGRLTKYQPLVSSKI